MKTHRRLSLKLDHVSTETIRAIGELVMLDYYAAKEATKVAGPESRADMAEAEAVILHEYRKLERFLDK